LCSCSRICSERGRRRLRQAFFWWRSPRLDGKRVLFLYPLLCDGGGGGCLLLMIRGYGIYDVKIDKNELMMCDGSMVWSFFESLDEVLGGGIEGGERLFL
jgi:hypothetical protein